MPDSPAAGERLAQVHSVSGLPLGQTGNTIPEDGNIYLRATPSRLGPYTVLQVPSHSSVPLGLRESPLGTQRLPKCLLSPGKGHPARGHTVF